MESDERNEKAGLILVVDFVTGITHLARPDEKQNGCLVTACGDSEFYMGRGRYVRVEDKSDKYEGAGEPTCEECFGESEYGDTVRKILDDYDASR